MPEAVNISTLITIVFGLMLTDLFAGVHRLIRNRRRIRWHWQTPLLAWYVLLLVLRNWWDLVFARGEGLLSSGWEFYYYGHLFLLIYLLSSAVLPDRIPDAGLDLREHYRETRRQFWGLMAGVGLLLMGYNLLAPGLTGGEILWPAVVSNGLMAVVSVSLVLVANRRYQATFVVLLTVLSVLDIVGKF